MTIRIGILGAARIAPQAIVAPARVVSGVKVAAVAARDRAKAQAFAAQHAIDGVRDDYRALVDDPDIDLVYNALPIHLHAEWSIAALRAGKHVLCEKPFAMNLQEAEAIVATAQTHDRRVIEAFHYRYHPAFETALTWIGEMGIGSVQRITAVFNASIPYRPDEIRHHKDTGGGAFMDLGCYCLSWTLTILDDTPTDVRAHAQLTTQGVDERMTAHLTFASGTEAFLSSSMATDDPPQRALTVDFEGGRVHFDNPLAIHDGGLVTQTQTGAPPRTHEADRITTYAWQLQAVARALRDATPLPTEGHAIVRQQRVLDAVYRAASLGHLRQTQEPA